jgi:DNA-binding transcriptional LysR family regulator
MTKSLRHGLYELTDLRLLVSVALTGKVIEAAEHCHLAPSSVSQRLTNLEKALGLALFERHARGLRLSSAGHVMLAHAQRCLAQLEQMHADLAPYTAGVHGNVTLFANNNAISAFLPGDLERFLIAHPKIRVRLEERSSNEIEDAVLHGHADIGIVANGSTRSGLDWFAYRDDELVLIIAKEYFKHLRPQAPAGQRAPARLTFSDCLDHPFVCLSSGSAIHTFIMEQARQLNRRLDVRVQVTSYSAVIQLVAAGVGVGIVPQTIADTANSAIKRVKLQETWVKRRLHLCVRQGQCLSAHTQALLNHLTKAESIIK